ncbi:MAG TPA: amidohydrolase [Candidatus Binatia bacterium]|nr:amidohydrolase [Candidatus Binatia bacterium]
MRPHPIAKLSCVAALLISSGAAFAADTLLVHGRIYTGNPKAPWAQALSISGTRIAAVGADREILSRQRAGTKIIDLHGQTVIPGFSDSHTHMWLGALALHGLNLSTPQESITPDENPDELVRRLKSYAANHPGDKIIFARADFYTEPPKLPTRELLDHAVPDRPVIVHNSAEHALWVNTPALRLAGITDQPVPNPEQEKYIVRDSAHRPTGVLMEAAMRLMEHALAQELSLEEKLALLRQAFHHLNSYGITSITNASGDLAEIQLYAALRDRGQLTVRVKTAFGEIGSRHHLTPEFLADLEKARSLYHDEWVSAGLVKFFADGGTGAIPPLIYEPEEYKNLVLALDKRGYQIETHTYRPDTAHMVVETYEAVEKENGPRDRRMRIEHADFVPAEDVPLLSTASLIPSMQPAFCCDKEGTNYDPNEHHTTDLWQSMEQNHVRLAFGSDWPCTWPVDPLIGIQEAVTRQIWQPPVGHKDFPGGVFDGAGQAGSVATPQNYAPQERLTVEQAVDAYTRGSAYARFSDDHVGTLEPGKQADLAVLSQNIFSMKPEEIAKSHVVLTMIAGRLVFEAGK